MKNLFAATVLTVLFSCNNHQEELRAKYPTLVAMKDGQEVDLKDVDKETLKNPERAYLNDDMDTVFVVIPSVSVVKK